MARRRGGRASKYALAPRCLPAVDEVHQATQFKWGFLDAAMLAVALFLRPVTRQHASAWLAAGLWLAVEVAPFAAIQCARLRLGATLDEMCLTAASLLFP